MKLDEIFDENDRQKQLDRAMAGLKKQFGSRPQSNPTLAAARQAQYTTHQATRDAYESSIRQLASQFGQDDFEAFKQAALQQFPDVERFINLQHAFNTMQPDRATAFHKSWDDYGKAREAGNDPMIHGIGTGGQRNWTGD